MTSTQPEVLRTYPMTSVPNHIVALRFNDDDTAVDFIDWLNTIGFDIFNHYYSKAGK
jgi:hypothetical protein